MVEVVKPKAVVLFSGGLDSSTCLKMAQEQGFSCYALSIAYGQKHRSELAAASKMAYALGAEVHKTMNLDLSVFSESALVNEAIEVPDYKDNMEIPSTYVPARNTVFLSLALAWAETLGAYDIFIGANMVDYSGYPDCRLPFLQAFEQVANLGTKAGVNGEQFHINAPLIQLNKAQIIQAGIKLGIDYSETVSCYRADEEGRACGTCDSCMFRKKGFEEAGIADPTRYQF